jgi:hydrogenase expression/formation protein HypC
MTDEARRCLTCGDVAVPMRVASLLDAELAVCVSGDGERCTVDIGVVPDVSAGDSILVHAGAALARLTEDAAERS